MFTVGRYENTKMNYASILSQSNQFKNIILLIISIIEYWSGNMNKRIKEAAAVWLPWDIHAIPLRVWNPDDNQVVPYQDATDVPGGSTD